MPLTTDSNLRNRVKNAATEHWRAERGSGPGRPMHRRWRGGERRTISALLLSLVIAITCPFSALAYVSGTNMRDTTFFARLTNGTISMHGENQLNRVWSSNGMCGEHEGCASCDYHCDGYEIDGAVAFSTTNDAVAAILADGSVLSWGSFCCSDTIESTDVDLSGHVTTIASTYGAFAALKTTGAIVTWGGEDYGGDSSDVESSLESGCTAISSNYYSFAALKADGSVVTWGYSSSNYGADSSTITGSTGSASLSSVSEIFSTRQAFAALTSSGTVACWGESDYQSYGGDCDPGNLYPSGSALTSVSTIYSGYDTFAALLLDGTVVAWGNRASSLTSPLPSVAKIFSTQSAFAALHDDGTVSVFGDSSNGGSTSSLSPSGSVLTSVSMIFATEYAFAALKSDGSVVCWGNSDSGGDCDSSDLITDSSNDLSSDVVYIAASSLNFAALKGDGSVVVWGGSNYGGSGDIYDIEDQLASGVIAIHSHNNGFGILKSNQSAYFWGSNIASVEADDMSISNYGSSHTAQNVDTIFGSNQYYSLSNNPKAPDGCASGTSTLSIATDGTMTTSSSCTACAAGMFDATVACLPCPYNSYSSGTSVSRCTTCAAGTEAEVRGSTAASVCTDCVAGKASNSSGSSCENCAAGYYSLATGSSSCTRCEEGTTGTLGASVCDKCPAGTTSYYYSDWDNGYYVNYISSCIGCYPTTYNPVAGGTCNELPPGHMSPDGVTVEACEESTVLTVEDGGSREYCKPCPTFFFSDCTSYKIGRWYYYSIEDPSAPHDDDYNDYRQVDYAYSFLKICRHPCRLFSLDVGEGPLSGMVMTLVVLFVCCFYYCRTPKEVVDVEATLQDLSEREEAIEKELEEVEEGEERDGSDGSSAGVESGKLPAPAQAHKHEEKTKKILVFDLVLAGKLFVYVAIPVSDTFTDLAYVCGARFYGVLFFALAFLFFMVPNIAFCRHLYLVGMRPKLLLPCYGIVPKSVQFEDYDNLVKVLVGFGVNIPWILLNTPYLLPKLVTGMFLYSTKVLAIGGVQTRWNRWWTGTDEYAVLENIDVHMLNESIYVEILAETFPQVIIQILNHSLINQSMTTGWDLVSGASIVVTILNTMNGLWKLLYYKAIKGINLDDIPVDFAIAQIIESDETQDKDEFVFELHDDDNKDAHDREKHHRHNHHDAHHHHHHYSSSDEDSEDDHLAWADTHHSDDDEDEGGIPTQDSAHHHHVHHHSTHVSERLGLLEAHYKELADEQKLIRGVLNEHSKAIMSAANGLTQSGEAAPANPEKQKKGIGAKLSTFVKMSAENARTASTAVAAASKEDSSEHPQHVEGGTEGGAKDDAGKVHVVKDADHLI